MVNRVHNFSNTLCTCKAMLYSFWLERNPDQDHSCKKVTVLPSADAIKIPFQAVLTSRCWDEQVMHRLPLENLLVVLVVSFFLGQALGFLRLDLLVLCPLLPLLYPGAKPIRVYLITACLSALWGALHFAPYLPFDAKQITIVRSNLLTPAYASLVKARDERSWLVKSSSKLGTTIDVKGQSQASSRLILSAREISYSQPASPRPFIATCREKIREMIARLDPQIRGFLEAIILGEMRQLPEQQLAAFKKFGIFHLLVVSGLHVTLLAQFVTKLCTLVLRLFYALALISPKAWLAARLIPANLTLALLISFGLMLNFPIPVQRAVLVFALSSLAAVFQIALTTRKQILLAMSLQIILFPVGLLSITFAFSWLSYLTVRLLFAATGGWVLRSLIVQLELMLLAIAFLGQLSALGVLLNPLLVPVFPGILLAALFATFGNGFYQDASDVAEKFVLYFLDCVNAIDAKLGAYSWYFVDLAHLGGVRLLALAVFSLWLWSSVPSKPSPQQFRDGDESHNRRH